MSFQEKESVQKFKSNLTLMESKFAEADKHAHRLANLCKAQEVFKGIIGEKWLPCKHLGVPCSSRAVAFIEPNNSFSTKKLIVACSEAKYCLLDLRPNQPEAKP